jgi:aminomethyltransferase
MFQIYFFFTGGWFNIEGVNCYVQRSGYTGEDGFEISIPSGEVEQIARLLLSNPDVLPAGLAARDSLRLEAGLSLYGHDIDEQTTPYQANLTWTISDRRMKEGGFIGSTMILGELKKKISELPKRRIGLVLDSKIVPREGDKIFDPQSNEQIGTVTSGGISFHLQKQIAMGYVKPPFHKLDTKLVVQIRNSKEKATVSKLPFWPTRYQNKKINLEK